MQLEHKKACLGWLQDRTPVKLLWSEALNVAAKEAAEQGRIEILVCLTEAVRFSNGEHADASIVGKTFASRSLQCLV